MTPFSHLLKFYRWVVLWASKPKVVCILYVEGDQLLGVARRGTTDQWGLPGGKVEQGETLLDAAVRECLEETHARPVGLQVLCRGWSRQRKVVQVYTAEGLVGVPFQGDAGSVAFISWTDLLDGPFGAFHQDVRRKFQKKARGL